MERLQGGARQQQLERRHHFSGRQASMTMEIKRKWKGEGGKEHTNIKAPREQVPDLGAAGSGEMCLAWACSQVSHNHGKYGGSLLCCFSQADAAAMARCWRPYRHTRPSYIVLGQRKATVPLALALALPWHDVRVDC